MQWPWQAWTSLQSQVSTLQKQVSTLQSQVATLQKQSPASLQSQITTLQSQVTTLTKDVAKMATQAEVDALTTAVNGVSADLTAAVANISAELTALQNANPSLDLTGLTTAVSGLQGVQATVDALETPPVTS